MNDFRKEYLGTKIELENAINEVLSSGYYILGTQTSAFEDEFAKYCDSKYCVGVANGLDAIYIILKSLGIGPGDEVITVSNSAVATALAITNTGAKAVFAEVKDDFLIDENHIEKHINKNTKAIVPVHLFGQIANMEALEKIAKRHGIEIVEDACQAHGAIQSGKKAGSFGIASAFSFYPTKNLGAIGDGGAIITSDKKLYEFAKSFRNYGQQDRYYHKYRGINSRLDELQSSILRIKLGKLDESIKIRNHIANLYIEGLNGVGDIILPKTNKNNYHAYHLFVIQTKKRDDLITYLNNNEITALIHYPVPIHKQECYPEYNSLVLEQTEHMAKTICSLPIYPFLSDTEVNEVINTIKQFYVAN